MYKKTKRKLKQRFHGYIYDMKKGEINIIADRIADDFELLFMEKDKQIKELQLKIKRLS